MGNVELKKRKLELLTEKLRRQSLEDLGAFIPYIKTKYEKPRHLQVLIDYFNDVAQGEKRNLALTVPPRHGKTETTLLGIAYYLRNLRENTAGYVSYSQTTAESKSVKLHEIIKELGLKLHPNLTNRKEFRLFENGGILTTARGGSLTGQGVDLLVIDDPFSNREEAESQRIRDKVWDWYLDVAETRLEPHGSQLVVHTRWHEDDLIGRLMNERDDFEYVRLPALEDGLDYKGEEKAETKRELGEALWPERYNEGDLLKTKKHSSYRFASLYQGLPRPREDYLFQEYGTYDKLPKQGLIYTICADLAYTEGERNDHSAIVVMAKKADNYYIIDVKRYQKKLGYSIKILKNLREKYGVRPGVEANGTQKGVVDAIKSEVSVEPLQPKGDKYTRSLNYSEAWNEGRVLLPSHKFQKEHQISWVNTYVNEHQKFTGVSDKSDDQVDAGSYCFNRLSKPVAFILT